MNNLKKIREIYGATQEHVANALGVNRVTIANWENSSSIASETNREKLSIFYGIGPEFFYEKDLDAIAESLIIGTAKKEKTVTEKSGGTRNKAEDLNRLFSKTSFDDAIRKYMFAMKLLLATADNGELEELERAQLINTKMDERLKAIIDVRKEEEKKKNSSNEPTLQELLNSFSEIE
ncbi:MAG: helix-turn-helix domain-containing protein [Firmicutes bacterium]|nr:helix-turn-helix domain-containing protein [Bacillota bacterium]